MKNKLFFSTLLTLSVLLAACAPQATPTSAPPSSTQEPLIPDTGASTAETGDTVMVANNPTLGDILVDSNGMTLYLFLKDTVTTTACTGGCAQNWPALTNASPSAGNGIEASMLGIAPGTNQVTYNGHLLYTFVKDKNPGDVNGQGLLDTWYAVSPSGDLVKSTAGASDIAAPTVEANTASMSGDTTVMIVKNPTLGDILVDSNGMTLYLFLKDTGTTTACTGACAQNWPALTSDSPNAGSGAETSLLGTAGGTNQVTYNGHLLYTFVKDKNPGDVNGQGVLDAWYAVSPSGNPVKPDNSSTVPTYGDYGY